jgi:membrane fusion protein (multidrug efflux system)
MHPIPLASAVPRSSLTFLACRLLPGILLATALAGCGAGPEQAPPQPPAVGVIAVAEEKVNPFYEFVGKTRAAETVALRARVTGFLEERAFAEGGGVEQDQVLFRIEPDQYEATLNQAKAALAAAEASLNRAQVDLARYRELAKAKNVSQQKVDEAEAEVLVQEAAVATARADVEKAGLNVGYTEIKAPIAGRIDVAAVDVGNLVGPETGVLATINLMDPIKATFSIAETWYVDLARADRAARAADAPEGELAHVPLIRLPDGTVYAHEGRFDFIDNKVDEATGTVQVRAEFPNPDRLLLPGQFVTIVIEREEAVDAVLIPQAAILTDQGGSYVLLVNDEDVVESRRIETGQRFGPNLVVKEGLKAGERIVLYGIQKVRPGIKVVPEMSAAPSDPMGDATGGSVRDEVIVVDSDGSSPDERAVAADSGAAAASAEPAAPAGDDDAADAAGGDGDADGADAARRSE